MTKLSLHILHVAACASALNFVEDGKEYVYKTEAGASAGTMDVATHTSGFSMKMTTRMQVSGNTLNLKVGQGSFIGLSGSGCA